MPVPSSISDLSTTPSLNSPAGTESPSTVDDYLRTQAAFIRQVDDKATGTVKAADLAATGGAALVVFQQAGAGAVARTVEDELRERVSVKQFGAVGDGVTDDSAAFQAAANYTKQLHIPEGVYVLGSSAWSITGKAFKLSGDGIGKTVLVWGGAGGGVVFSSATAQAIEIEGLTLAQTGQGVGAALTYVGSSQISGGVIQQRTAPRLYLRNVEIRGATASTVDGWDCHVDLIDAMHCTIDGLHITGHCGAGGQTDIVSSAGIRITETPDVGAVEFCISNSWGFWVDSALQLSGCEGVLVRSCNFVGVNHGVNATSVLQLGFQGCHISSNKTGIIGGITQSQITGNLFYCREGTDPITLIEIQSGRSFNVIEGNTFVNPTLRVVTGIGVLSNAAHNTISSNVFRAMAVGVNNGGTNTSVGINTYSSVAQPVIGVGTFDQAMMFTPAVEICGGDGVNPLIDFKNQYAEDADCRIQQSLSGLNFEVGGDGNRVARLALTGTGGIIMRPPAAPQTLTQNRQLTIEAPTNGILRLRMRGDDGVTRSIDLSLT